MKLKVSLKGDVKNIPGRKKYYTEVNAENFKEIALVLTDLENNGLPIKKAINEFRIKKSDWDIALGV
jgi:hypothetical protein